MEITLRNSGFQQSSSELKGADCLEYSATPEKQRDIKLPGSLKKKMKKKKNNRVKFGYPHLGHTVELGKQVFSVGNQIHSPAQTNL